MGNRIKRYFWCKEILKSIHVFFSQYSFSSKFLEIPGSVEITECRFSRPFPSLNNVHLSFTHVILCLYCIFYSYHRVTFDCRFDATICLSNYPLKGSWLLQVFDKYEIYSINIYVQFFMQTQFSIGVNIQELQLLNHIARLHFTF